MYFSQQACTEQMALDIELTKDRHDLNCHKGRLSSCILVGG